MVNDVNAEKYRIYVKTDLGDKLDMLKVIFNVQSRAQVVDTLTSLKYEPEPDQIVLASAQDWTPATQTCFVVDRTLLAKIHKLSSVFGGGGEGWLIGKMVERYLVPFRESPLQP